MDSSIRSWDAVADDWVSHADENDYRNHFLMPFTLELLGDVRGARILDVGCGEGGYSRALAARGASVVGVDGSERLVTVARERAARSRLEIEFVRDNASSLEAIPSQTFDVVLAAMVLMDVEDYDGAIAAARRVLAPGGVLVMSLTHPCFSAPVSEWIRTDSGEPRHFAVDRYFERAAWDDFITPRFRQPVVRRHRPLQDYIRPLRAAGFRLRDFLEPTPTPAQMAMSPRLSRLARIPYFLFMSWDTLK